MKTTNVNIRIEADPESTIKQLELQLNGKAMQPQPDPKHNHWQGSTQISGALNFDLRARGSGALKLILRQRKRTILRKRLAFEAGTVSLTIEGIPLLG